MTVSRRLYVIRGTGIRFIPFWCFWISSDHQQRQSDHSVNLRHVFVIHFVPMVARPMVIGIVECNTKGMCRHTHGRERLVVAAAEIGIAVGWVLVNANAGGFSCGLKDRSDF